MTLTEVSAAVKKYLPYVVLGALVILIFFYIIQIVVFFVKSNQKTIVTDTVFGIINRPVIQNASSSAGINFDFDTVEGTPITATESARVYFLPPSVPKFGYRENVFLMAQNIGIDTQTANYRLVDTQASFTTDRQKLTVDIGNFNFNYQYEFEKEPELFDTYASPIAQEAEIDAVGFLQSVGRYPEELATAEVETIYFFFDPQQKNLKQVQKNNEANLVEVDYFRPKIDGFPTVTTKFPNSHNHVLAYFADDLEFRVLNARIDFYEKSNEQVGIYPLKSGKEAYENLRQGKAQVIKNPGQQKKVTIKKMFLAYFDPDTYQEYLQPVYVFIGEDDFVAFVPAVKDEFLAK